MNITNKIMNKSTRFERKWVFRNNDHLLVLNFLLRSNFFFKFHYPPRYVNSIYFDDKNLSSITSSIEGVSDRKKYRIRWYGHNNQTKLNFEIKEKKGFETTKKIISLEKFKNVEDLTDIIRFVNEEIVLDKVLQPTLLINYHRIYLISSNNLIRATIDYEIKCKRLLNFENNFFSNFSNVILELKYDSNLDQTVRNLLKNIKVRYSKNSKYVNSALNYVTSFS